MDWISQNSDLAGLVLAAFVIVVTVFIVWLHVRTKRSSPTAGEPSSNQPASVSASEALTPPVDPLPELTVSALSFDLNPAIQKNVFLLHVQNETTSAAATARNVVANIGYKRKNGQAVWVDYGAWMERGTITSIEKGETKNLVLALTDDGKNFAVNWTGPQSKFGDPTLVPVGELTPGQWMMVVTISAENYEKIFRFLLTIGKNGAIKCRSVARSLW
ncbi:MAG: hypothetical protein WAN14_04850 [Candidatus Acidiferrales bacterium]